MGVANFIMIQQKSDYDTATEISVPSNMSLCQDKIFLAFKVTELSSCAKTLIANR